MSDTVIKVEGLYKKFCTSLKRSMLYGTYDALRDMSGISYDATQLRKHEFWALQDINFELKRGEALGLIGQNGSGKSTLLRLLNGIFPPDKGKITINGRIGALIAVGAGFHPHLTGRENIYLNGTILGMTKQEIKGKFDEIVDFAEIGEFIDAPVATYSSGMTVRLGFAIAINCEPDILLIDEILAVGDIGFQSKCFNRITELLKSTATILVSHSMPHIGRICTDLILMEHGKIEFKGDDVSKGIELYHEKFKSEPLTIVGSGKARIHSLTLYSSESDPMKDESLPIIKSDESIILELNCQVNVGIKKFTISIGIIDSTLRSIAIVNSKTNKMVFHNDGKPIKIKINIPNLFSPSKYTLNINFFEESENDIRYGEELAGYRSIKQFKVIGSSLISYTPIQLKSKWLIQSE